MNSNDMQAPPRGASNSSHDMEEPTKMAPGGHLALAANDPDNPQNFPLFQKVYVSAVAFAFAFVVAFGATSYTAGLQGVQKAFNVSMTVSILGFSLYLWGIAFAPIYTPHLSERFGRQVLYLFSLPICALFILGASFSRSFQALAVCRFFAGLAGGPCLVLIEGTFADVWSAEYTLTYYAALTLSSFFGAASGPIAGGYLVAYGGWRWSQWIVLILAFGVYLFGIAQPDTYAREILRRRAKRTGTPINLAPAQSGVTLRDMAFVTIIQPIKMAVTEPIVMALTLWVGFIFGLTFQWFITVPAVLTMTYNFTLQQDGLAFTSAIAGVALAAVTTFIIDVVIRSIMSAKTHEGRVSLEFRMVPGMLGGLLMTASFFWIGWSAKPTVHFLVPIFGTMVFVWGAALSLITSISYLFDAFPPRGTLSALTVAATFRILLAGLIPMVIIQMIMKLGGGWTFAVFGFISAALSTIPFLFFFFGSKLRARSSHNPHMASDMMPMTLGRDEEMQRMEMSNNL